MRHFALICVLVCLGPRAAFAQSLLSPASIGWGSSASVRNDTVTSPVPHPSVARIIVPNRDGMSFGSGTLVDVREKHGLLLTNNHVVDGASDEITVRFPDGFVSGAKIIKVDKVWDLAALAVWRPNVPAVPIATQAPQPGDWLGIAGYGQGTFRFISGHCTQYFAPRSNYPQELVEVSVAARQGDSGGPILNQRGELAGVLFGASVNSTMGSYCGRVRAFLDGVLPAAPSNESSLVATAAVPGSNLAASHSTDPNKLLTANPVLPAKPGSGTLSPVTTDSSDQSGANTSRSLAGASPFTTEKNTATAGLLPLPSRSSAAPRFDSFAPSDKSLQASGSNSAFSPTPLGDYASPAPATGPTTAEELTWEQFAGKTPLEQGKTIFAGIGGLSLLLVFLRLLGNSPK